MEAIEKKREAKPQTGKRTGGKPKPRPARGMTSKHADQQGTSKHADQQGTSKHANHQRFHEVTEGHPQYQRTRHHLLNGKICFAIIGFILKKFLRNSLQPRQGYQRQPRQKKGYQQHQ